MVFNKEVNPRDILKQLESENYETFDDYLEIILEFAYLTLFAEAFPMAPIFVLIVNNIEFRSDIFKLATIYKRPQYIRKRNIGSWHLIIQVISTLSVFTNMLFTITHSNEKKTEALGASQMLLFFILEHAVFIIIILIRLLISSQAYWVGLFLKRRENKLKANKWTRLFDKEQIFEAKPTK